MVVVPTMRLMVWWYLAVFAILAFNSMSDANLSRAENRHFTTLGLCQGRQLRYAYNEKTKRCIGIYYPGCSTFKTNNFLTFEECRRDCMEELRY